MISKVLAYITRQRGGETQLLVFEHADADFRDAGVQVPKGTVKPGEAIERAARREVREETGLTALDGLKWIGRMTQTAFGAAEEWNFFSLRTDGDVPDAWTHRVQGEDRKASREEVDLLEDESARDDLRDEDEGMLFRYSWVPLARDLELAGRQHDGFQFLRDLIANLR